MKNNIPFKLSTISLVIASTLPSYTNAATDAATQASDEQVERISVTANRKEQLDTELAMSVETVSSEELALDNGQHLADSLNSLSGVLINQLQGRKVITLLFGCQSITVVIICIYKIMCRCNRLLFLIIMLCGGRATILMLAD